MGNEKQVNSFRDLIAWQKGMDLVCETYRLTRQLPVEERYGLCSQMRRCATSIPANVSEGWGRETTKDYLRFLHIARGSAVELITHTEICHRLEFGNDWQVIIDSAEELIRILNGLIRSLRSRQ